MASDQITTTQAAKIYGVLRPAVGYLYRLRERMREATVRGLTVFELPEAEQQGEQFLSLVREMINRGTKKGEETLNPLPDESVLQRIANG